MISDTPQLALLSTLLFTLMGPIAVIPLFAAATAGAKLGLRRRIALTAFLTALVTLALAVLVGAAAMAKAGTSPSSLIIAAGLILTLTALRNIVGSATGGASGQHAPVTAGLGFSPIAIPGIVTPVGVAVLIIFASYFPTAADKLAIMGVVAGIMMLNLFAMLGAAWFMRRIGAAPLLVLGAVFGVLQAAMGVEMLISGLKLSQLMR
jgi:multiple antibiotic resistance protein